MDPPEKTEFWSRLLDEIIAAFPRNYGRDNWDAERFGPYPRPANEIPRSLISALTRSSVTPPCPDAGSSIEQSYTILYPYLDDFAATYTLLDDHYSRALFIRLIVFRILGFRKVKLPLSLDPAGLERAKETIRHLVDPAAGIMTAGTWKLDLVDLHPLGYPVRCYSTESGILTTFLQKQYEYRQGDRTISVSPGDYIIDGGGGWGDTALFFACAAGDQGKVFSFEFDPENLAVFHKNMVMNPALSRRISIIPRALWSRSGDALDYAGNGPGTTIASGYDQKKSRKELQATTLSIDDFVQRERLARVDYIKMDIEAAEMDALKGAAGTIRRFRPVLAIAVYHKPSDFALIPQYLRELAEKYSFFLDHHTIHHEETVLFAVPDEKLAGRDRKGSVPTA